MQDTVIDPSQGVIVTFSIYALLVTYLLIKRPSFNDHIIIISSLLLLASALYFGLMSAVSIPFTSAFALTGVMARSKIIWLRYVSWTGFTLFSLAFALHIIPGFQNELIFHSEGIGVSNLPYWLYANLDKGIAGIVVLLFTVDRFRPFKWKIFFQRDFFVLPVLCIAVFGAGLLLGVPWDVKFGAVTLAFIFFNLFVTCFAEEVFFRLLIQETLQRHFPLRKYASFFAITVSASFFMLAHFHTAEDAEKRLLLIFIAGLGYAFIYSRSRLLLSAMGCHFGVNLLHFTFFAYPAIFQ